MVEVSNKLSVEEPYCRLNARMLLNSDPEAQSLEGFRMEKLEEVLNGARAKAEEVLDKFPREYYDDLIKPSWVNLSMQEAESIQARLKMEKTALDEVRDSVVSFKGQSFIVSMTLYQCG